MQLGRVVESALQAKADAYVSEIYEALRDAAIASRSNKPIGDKMILNAAFLVDREKTKTFDDQITDIAVWAAVLRTTGPRRAGASLRSRQGASA